MSDERRFQRIELAIQRLRLNAKSSARRIKATAKALRDADKARRRTSEQAWTPLTRLSVVVAIAAALTALYFGWHK